jgi:hypothetical protein
MLFLYDSDMVNKALADVIEKHNNEKKECCMLSPNVKHFIDEFPQFKKRFILEELTDKIVIADNITDKE